MNETEITVGMHLWLKAAIDRKAEAEDITADALVRKAVALYVMGRTEEEAE